MKIQDLLNESTDFKPTYQNKETGRIETPYEKVEEICPICDGTKVDYNEEPCRTCDQTGKHIARKYTVPTLNVGYSNLSTVLRLLGLDNAEEYGEIKNKDLAEVRKRLIKIKNSNKDQYTEDPSEYTSEKKRVVDKSGSTPKISTRGGSTFISMGRSSEKIDYYIDKLLEIIDVCQKNGYDLSWH